MPICSHSGPIIQGVITLLSFVSTATIANFLEDLIDDKDKPTVIILASIFSLALSFYKLYIRERKVHSQQKVINKMEHRMDNIDAKNRKFSIESIQEATNASSKKFRKVGKYVAAYKAIVIQVVDSVFDVIVAISLIHKLKYGEGSSILLIFATFIGFGEEVFELVFEITFCICESAMGLCTYGMIALVLLEFFGCILELSFGIYLGMTL